MADRFGRGTDAAGVYDAPQLGSTRRVRVPRPCACDDYTIIVVGVRDMRASDDDDYEYTHNAHRRYNSIRDPVYIKT